MFIVKIPAVNSSLETQGCERSGEAIIKELRKINVNEEGKEIDVDSLDLEEIHIDNSDLERTNNLIYENAGKIFETKPKVIFLGGDQSITYPLVKSFMDYCENHDKEPCLIVFDAHPDCMGDYAYASRKKDEIPTNEEWLRALVEEGFPAGNILLVGIRNKTPEENTFLKKYKIQTFMMGNLSEDLRETCDTIMEFSNGKELYVSIDIDVVDPSFAPSTAKTESGGLTSRELIYLIKRINKIKNLRAVDLTEINLEMDKEKNNHTIKLGAKIVSELI